jgi:hypothetical protein
LAGTNAFFLKFTIKSLLLSLYRGKIVSGYVNIMVDALGDEFGKAQLELITPAGLSAAHL